MKLVGKNIVMYSFKDGETFLSWVTKIDCIETIAGCGSEVYFYLVSDILFASDVDDLMGLFSRYKIDVEQLKKLSI